MKLKVHNFLMGDVDEPELYASAPLAKWQETDKAKWLKENSKVDLTYCINPYQWGFMVEIYADLDHKRLTYYKLKWGTNEVKY